MSDKRFMSYNDAANVFAEYASGIKSKANTPKYRTVTLEYSNWVNNSQTVTVAGVVADETKQLIQPVPNAASMSKYYECGVRAVSQSANSLTFLCNETPDENLTVYAVITEVSA